MARISGVDLPRDKRIEVGLTYIFGIGRTTAKKIIESTKEKTRRVKSKANEWQNIKHRKNGEFSDYNNRTHFFERQDKCDEKTTRSA